LPISLPDEKLRWSKGIFELGSRFSEFLSSLTPRTLSWSATAAAVVILVQAAVITAVLVKEPGALSVMPGEPPVRAQLSAPAAKPDVTVQAQSAASADSPEKLIAALVAGGRQLMLAGDIANARLVLQQAAQTDNATAALELGATYDPTILPQQVGATIASVLAMTDMADVRMARLWYERARDLGSTEAAVRLEKLRSVASPGR
jgi:hypothetical protein